MGLIFSRFYDKPSTRDTLERIEQELQNIEERRWDKIKREQFIIQILSFIPITILIANVCIFIYPSESTWRDKLILSIPIFLLNLLLWVCRKVVQWYSKWSLDNEEVRLRKLHKEKKKILEMVCETESYKVATELLEKYDPKQLRRREKASERPSSPLNSTLTKLTASPIRSPQQQHHQTLQSPVSFHNQSISFPIQASQVGVPAPPPPTPISKPNPGPSIAPSTQQKASQLSSHNTSIAPVAASSVQGRPVRPILSKDRSIFERLVDWVVADGPDNRFALICRYCYGHNGMSLAEEYETINFRCCYCYNLNTATNKRTQVHDQLQPEREKSNSITKPDQVEAQDNNGTKLNKDTVTRDTKKEERKNGKSRPKSSKPEDILEEEASNGEVLADNSIAQPLDLPPDENGKSEPQKASKKSLPNHDADEDLAEISK